MLKEVLKLMRAITPSTISIETNLPSQPIQIKGDITQVHQVFLNLCSNSVYAMRDQGGMLSIRLRPASLDSAQAGQLGLAAGHYVKIVVKDTGVGIDPKVQDRIFDPFFTTKPKGEGTGLGLSVVHGIVKEHGGQIQVHSTPGQGTQFTMWIPQIRQPTVELKESTANTTSLGSEHILLVDDEPAILQMGRLLLDHLGYQTSVANSGQQALELIQQSEITVDLVLTDDTMPSMTGHQLATEIKKIAPELPIVLMTGFNRAVNPSQLKQKGFEGILHKPFDMHQFNAVVRALVENRRQT